MKKRRTFSAEYRRDAVRLVLEQGYSQAEAALVLALVAPRSAAGYRSLMLAAMTPFLVMAIYHPRLSSSA